MGGGYTFILPQEQDLATILTRTCSDVVPVDSPPGQQHHQETGVSSLFSFSFYFCFGGPPTHFSA